MAFACRGDHAGNPAGIGGGDSPPGDLCITEIMYHPVDEHSLKEVHEFIEIKNRGKKTLDLSEHKLRGVGFTFPDRKIKPGEFLVIAKDPDALLASGYYQFDPDQALGGYPGQLSNSGETIVLEARNGTSIDAVTYDDGFPWPVLADGLGVGESWLSQEYLPLSAHRNGGVSLERVTCTTKANSPGNWEASGLDAASPGADYQGASDAPASVVRSLSAEPLTGSVIRAGDEVRVSVGWTAGQRAGAALEYFIDDLESENEPTSVTPLGANGSVTLEGAADNSIVRYRVVTEGEGAREVISPRPSDPYGWHAYFVEPEIETTSRLYHLFIAPGHWTELWDNIESGRAQGCDVNERWQGRVPAVFVHDGHVYDVQARYQGSRWNRANGPDLGSFGGERPDRPSPLKGLSFRIGFPRYDRFEGKGVLTLNKLTQGCPGYTATVGFELFRRAGIPAAQTRYARVQANGAYYRYMLEIERVDEDLLAEYHESTDFAEVGHLFKAAGLDGDEGPWGFGDARLLAESCGYSEAARYTATYPRQTHEWAGPEMIQELLSGLHAARDEGGPALRGYLSEQFDVELMLNYLAVINYLAPFDDMYHNYWFYRRLTDDKWILLPWDLDRTMGGNQASEASLFLGEEGDPDNTRGMWNYVKDSFFDAYRDEYEATLRARNRDLFPPSVVKALIDDARAQVDVEEAQEAPGGTACDFEGAVSEMKTFAEERSALISDLSSTPF